MQLTRKEKAKARNLLIDICIDNRVAVANKKTLTLFRQCRNFGLIEASGSTMDSMKQWLYSVESPGAVAPSKKQKTKRKKKQRHDFYSTDQWRALRYKVLKRYQRRCMCCGASPDDGKTVLHVDHIKPRSKYPALELDENNLQILCADCNLGKGNSDEIDYRPNTDEQLEAMLADELRLAYELRCRIQ
jgi:5-methylcytosine-specific restriction endonuclease McrA